MSMGGVLVMPNSGNVHALTPLPDLTVVEVSIIVALLRIGPAVIDALCPVLTGWFMKPVVQTELAPSVSRLQGRGWLVERPGGELVPSPSAYEPTQRLYSAFIRMLAREGSDGDAPPAPGPSEAAAAGAVPPGLGQVLQLRLVDDNEKVPHDPA